ncbi:MAG: PHP domain-containing protein [Clostridia bacterium]|nr:PHP domain-containing protein [Clostridia bacterium]
MKYKVDHDLHIHSNISSCSYGKEQTPERILRYAEENGFRKICLTDHFWDERSGEPNPWYRDQNFAHINAARPLPESDNVKFLFGCETELRHDLVLGISAERFDEFDFVVIPTTHLHFQGFTVTEKDNISFKARADAWVRRLDAVLSMDIPFHKTGIAHLTTGLISPEREQYLEVIREISENDMYRLFRQAAKVGVGIELNASVFAPSETEKDMALLPYRIAKECGCKFYCGSDAHEEEHFFYAKPRLENAAELLGLTEDDKFVI